MSGDNILVDTNIILYLLSGDQALAELLNNKSLYISFISELELLGFKNISEKEQENVKRFLSVTIVDINSEIKKTNDYNQKRHKNKVAGCDYCSYLTISKFSPYNI